MSALIVSSVDGLFGRLLLGFVEASSRHPLLTVAFFGLLLAVIGLLWVEMLNLSA